MKEERFDLVVIGGGPGGYPAAIRGAQNGKKVALIEAKELGGTCLNRGCIPSKTLIASAEALKKVKQMEEFGIQVGNISFDFKKMVDRKDRIVGNIRTNLKGLIHSHGIALIEGFGTFISPTRISVEGPTPLQIRADKTIIATGSEPKEVARFPFDYEKIHDSTSMLAIKKLPQTLIIVGGGIIGCEFASLYITLGTKVTILEAMPTILPMESSAVSSFMTSSFTKKGVKLKTTALVEGIDKTKKGVKVQVAGEEPLEGEMVLIAIGRSLNTKNMGLDQAGVKVNPDGSIPVNDKMETNIPGIFAIGDITGKWWLAHVASHQGLVAADNASGKGSKMHYNAVPSVIFTDPEIGTVGLTLEKALEKGYKATVGAFPFSPLGKAQATFQTDGFAQIVTDKETGQILGAQVIGYDASTLIAEMSLAIANELTVACLSETLHAHPTIAEVWLEAALMAEDRPLHMLKKRSKR